MKVLCGVNGSEGSRHAVEFACRLLDPQRDSVALYCSPPKIAVPRGAGTIPSMPATLEEAFTRTVFDNARAAIPQELAAAADCVTGHQPAADGLIHAAAAHGADLIVVGADSHPRKLLFYIGGVAHAVAQRSVIPVLIHRPIMHPLPHGGIRVLLADDGSSASTQAAHFLHRFSWPPHSEGWLIRVLEWLDLGSMSDSSLSADLLASWRTEYDRAVTLARSSVFDELKAKRQELSSIFHETVPIVGEGHRIVEIQDAIQREKIDLLVVGARNLTTLQRFLGSTTEGLLRQAPCSVLVVHEHNAGSA